MPLGKDVGKNIKELYADNKKSGKDKGADGKPRPRAQIIAIAMHSAGKTRRTSNGHMMKNKA
jgi:hypothetical protein